MTAASHPWIEQLLDDTLVNWRHGADTANGIFNPYLDRQWRRQAEGPRTLVTQCRLIYNFVRAYERDGDEAWAALVGKGIEALLRFFRTPEGRGYHWSVDGDGQIVDDRFDAYGHAFVLLALSTAATGLGARNARELALETHAFLNERFGDAYGGLIWKIDRAGNLTEEPRSQNPMMHTFEALLALDPLDGSGAARADALAIWGFLKARMPVPGALPEWYEADWTPLATGPRARVEIGHVFEWAWLLSEAAPLFPEEDLLVDGRMLLEFGMRHGYDHATGGIHAGCDDTGNLIDSRKGWWEQCEAIRAISRYVTRHDRGDLAAPLGQSLDFVYEHFVDSEYGGWYSAPPGLGAPTSLVKGHISKLDYHVVNMCRELLAE